MTMLDSDSSTLQRWVSPAMASGFVLVGALGLGLVLYNNQSSKSKGGIKKKGKSTTKPKSKVHSTSDSASDCIVVDDSDVKGDMKGYKTNSKGQKTTYFNRELTEEEKQLIGDITPKKINSSACLSTLSSDRATDTSPSGTTGGSAWNKAGEDE